MKTELNSEDLRMVVLKQIRGDMPCEIYKSMIEAA